MTIEVVVKRPGWLGWALGKRRHERLTVRAPVAHVRSRWISLPAGSPLEVKLDHPVSAFAYGSAGRLSRRALESPADTLRLPRPTPAGTIELAVAARPWERLGPRQTVTWFPPSSATAAVTVPSPGASVSPRAPIRITFSKPVREALGPGEPTWSPPTPGRWRQSDSHTLVFTPAGFGAGFGVNARLNLPRPVEVAGKRTRSIDWRVPQGSKLRLQQLLAQAGYLPLRWKPIGQATGHTPSAELQAAVRPPAGHFRWRYRHAPAELRRLWRPGKPNALTRGAVMTFENEHGLTTDGIAGPAVWKALLADAIAAKRHHGGYSYVYVHRAVPQSLTLWHDGRTVLRSPGNTGVPAAPTKLGIFPVFEHIPVGTMSGTNPDGSHYRDPGIRYISYFNGGDAIHAFNRASFGTPQSLGCVELPLAAAKKVWPYTPIGTLVTVEN